MALDLVTLGIEVQTDGIQDATERLADLEEQSDRTGTATGKLESRLAEMLSQAAKLISLGYLANQFQALSSVWTDLTSRVDLATQSQAEAEIAMKRIGETADRTYASLESTAEIFLRNADAFTDLGYSTQQQLDFMSAMTDALVVSGAKAERAESVINALSKAMMAGTLRGENWNTVLQSGGRVVSALADGLGVSISQLRSMAETGELSSDKVFKALTAQMERLKNESESMPATISDAFQRLDNALLTTVGRFSEVGDTSGVVVELIDTLTSVINWFTKQLESDSANWVQFIAVLPAGIRGAVELGTVILAGFIDFMVTWGKGVLNAINPLGPGFKEVAQTFSNEVGIIYKTMSESVAEIDAKMSASINIFDKSADATNRQGHASQYASIQARDLAAAMALIADAKMPETLIDAVSYLNKYTANTEAAKTETRELAKAMADTSIAKVFDEALAAGMAGDSETQKRLLDQMDMYMARVKEANKMADDAAAKSGKSAADKAIKAARDQAKAYQDIQIALARVNNEFELLRKLENEQQVSQFAETVKAAGLKFAEADAMIEKFRLGLEKQVNTKHLSEQLDFYKELRGVLPQAGEKYAELRQQILDQQAAQLEGIGITREAIAEWRGWQELREGTDAVSGLTVAIHDYIDGLTAASQAQGAFQVFTSGTETAFVSMITGAKSARDAFADLGEMIVNELARIAVQMLILKPLMTGLGGLFGGGGSIWGSLAGSLKFWADGGVPNAPGLHKYANSIVTKPTIFPFAKGAGIMGEDGPEAIMPLSRDNQGRLGVSMTAADSYIPQDRPIRVIIEDHGTPKQYNVKYTTADEVRLIATDVVRNNAASVVASDMGNPNGVVSKSMASNFVNPRKRVA